tara:strand:- start:32182 stop:32478 length:297 start_codon:yes stop_codon:yes gene_type:complete
MSRNLSIPYFPNAPQSYNQQYAAEVVRAFSLYVQQVQNPGEGRNTFSVFTNLQTDDSSLELGAIFNHEGYVKIAEINTPHLRGSAGTGQVGAVTVVIG